MGKKCGILAQSCHENKTLINDVKFQSELFIEVTHLFLLWNFKKSLYFEIPHPFFSVKFPSGLFVEVSHHFLIQDFSKHFMLKFHTTLYASRLFAWKCNLDLLQSKTFMLKICIIQLCCLC